MYVYHCLSKRASEGVREWSGRDDSNGNDGEIQFVVVVVVVDDDGLI